MKIDYTCLNGLTNTVNLSNDASIISNGHFQLYNSLKGIDSIFNGANMNYIKDITIYEVPSHVNNFSGCCFRDGWWEGMPNLCNFTLKDARIDNLSKLVRGCSKIEKVDISNSIINPNANAWCAFYGCENLYDFGQNNKDIFSNVGILYYAFDYCVNLSSEITLNLKSATDIDGLFMGCSNLSKIVIDNLTENINSIYNICSECFNLKEIVFNNCNIQYLYASHAFRDCYLLENFSGMSSVNNVQGRAIFDGCKTIKSLPSITMKTGYLMNAFGDCQQLQDLDIDFINDEDDYFWMADMFNNCSNLSNNSLVNIAQNLPSINTVVLKQPIE